MAPFGSVVALKLDFGKIYTWIRDEPLGITYPSLYHIARKKDATVAHVLSTIPLNISFHRARVEDNLRAWHDLVSKLVLIQLTNDKDTFVWNLHSSGIFSVRSMYMSMIKGGIVPYKGGIQPPSSIANMFGPRLNGFRPKLKSRILVGAAAICWTIWLNRNDMVFKGGKSNTFLQVIFRAIYWIRTWSLLHKEDGTRSCFKNGCMRLETVIMEVFAMFGWRFRNRIFA